MADSAAVYEKLGVFYLGRPYDLKKKAADANPLLYDSKDLVTHAVCVGMTGSGKTGLLIGLLEEAAIDNVPALVIDPKGDLANLLLTFPELRPEDFAPWVDPDAAARAGLTPEQFAAQQAETWKKGLSLWDQTGERIARLRAAADFRIYTPGSEAGIPISVLSSFAAPPEEVVADGDLMRDRVGTLVSSLLALLDVESDPIQGREHILLSTIFDAAWRKGEGLDLAALIAQIQKPPVERIGVMDVESIYPAKERFGLAMACNNLLGSPGFQVWLQGEPLDVDRLLYTPAGKPRIAVLSIAHLSDKERMFFVSLLLNQTIGWMRSRPGTSSLRALLCMDEIFGYMPPVAEPPSKRPMLTLLKQARAFGLGLVLATQNPVDLDYKGLSNVGTWFIGRLQTERDKARLMDGLEGASGGAAIDRAALERTLASLGSRVFYLRNVHEDEPVVFQTRWTLSYLRGPLTRPEIKRLTDPVRPAAADSAAGAPDARAKARGGPAAPATSAVTAGGDRSQPAAETAAGFLAGTAPVLPPEIEQRFLALRAKPVAVVYEPGLLGLAIVHFRDAKSGVGADQEVSLWAPLGADGVDWYSAAELAVGKDDLEREPVAGARFAALPPEALKVRSYAGWQKDFAECLFRSRSCDLLSAPDLGLTGSPGESERDFRIRIAERAREARDEAVETLRGKYSSKLGQLQERIRRALAEREKQATQAKSQALQSVVSVGAAVLGAFFGRKRTMTAASAAVRGASRAWGEHQDVGRAEETVESLQGQLAALNAQLEAEVKGLESRFDPQAVALAPVSLKPKKGDVEVRLVTLAWSPKLTLGAAAET